MPNLVQSVRDLLLNLLIIFTQNYSIFRESIHSKFGKTNKFYKRDVNNPNHGTFLLSSTRKINTKNIKKYDYERARAKAKAREEALRKAEEFVAKSAETSEENEANIDVEMTE